MQQLQHGLTVSHKCIIYMYLFYNHVVSLLVERQLNIVSTQTYYIRHLKKSFIIMWSAS
jgi:hypothetical protein